MHMNRDQIAGKIQKRYGVTREEAEKQIADWERKASDSWFSTGKKISPLPLHAATTLRCARWAG